MILKKIAPFIIVSVLSIAFGYFWHFMATGGF
jgi:hypothetical protein